MFLSRKILNKTEVPFKQRSFEDSIDTFFSLFDADLLLIWMNNFWHGFRFRSESCPVFHIVLIIFARGVYQETSKNALHLVSKKPNRLEYYS